MVFSPAASPFVFWNQDIQSGDKVREEPGRIGRDIFGLGPGGPDWPQTAVSLR